MLRKLDDDGSVVPVVLFILSIFGCGALYTLFFLEVGLPTFSGWIPDSDAKTFILMLVYAIPLAIVVIGVLALLISGLKSRVFYGG